MSKPAKQLAGVRDTDGLPGKSYISQSVGLVFYSKNFCLGWSPRAAPHPPAKGPPKALIACHPGPDVV